jgi:hypothetical protein
MKISPQGPFPPLFLTGFQGRGILREVVKMGYRKTLSKKWGYDCSYEIVHEGDDYLAVWVKQKKNERFCFGKSEILEIETPLAHILADTLPVKIRY